MKRHYFNLIELMLALGVIVVGLVSVMALFPIGANANRDAIAENYSAMAAEQMLNSLAHYIRSSGTVWTSAVESGGIHAFGGTDTVTDKINHIKNQQPIPGSDYEASVPSGLVEVAGNMFMKSSNNFKEGFRIEAKGGVADEYMDFEGMMALWQEKININGVEVDYPYGTVLNIEISWPSQLPYNRRQKARYRLEVFNPNR